MDRVTIIGSDPAASAMKWISFGRSIQGDVFSAAFIALGIVMAGCASSPGSSPGSSGKAAVAPEMRLIEAARNGDTKLVQALIDEGNDINHIVTEYIVGGPGSASSYSIQHTPLSSAAGEGHGDIVLLLLKHGARVSTLMTDGDSVNNYSVTALHVASGRGQLNIVAMLLDAGADPNLHAPSNGTLRGNASETPLMFALGNKHAEVATLLLQRGADLNFRTPNNLTALIDAASTGNSWALEFLLSRHVEMETAADDGRTALIIAAAKGHTDVCTMLIHAGARMDAADRQGNNALRNALNYEQFATAKALVMAGSTCTFEPKSSEEQFIWAVYQNCLGEKKSSDGDVVEANQCYRAAERLFTKHRSECQKAAEIAETSASKASLVAFWRTMGNAVSEGVATGLVGAAVHVATSGQYGITSMPTAVVSSKQTEAEQLKDEARRFRERVRTCDDYLSKIPKPNPPGVQQNRSEGDTSHFLTKSLLGYAELKSTRDSIDVRLPLLGQELRRVPFGLV